jgi:hypoxanthine-guanine phosphoribosyltransferase
VFQIKVPHHVDFMAVSSYGSDTIASSNVKVQVKFARLENN